MSTIGRIHSFESCGTVDGPGIRFITFFQGCLMFFAIIIVPVTGIFKAGGPVTAFEKLYNMNANYFSFEREPASVGNGTVKLVFYIPQQDFAFEAYTEIYLTAEGALAQDSLGDDYRDTVDAVKARVEGIADARCEARYSGIVDEARAELDDIAVRIDPRLAEVAEAVDTIGGLTFVLAGHVPPVGDILQHESGWRIEVTAGNDRHVTRLRLHPPSESENPDD